MDSDDNSRRRSATLRRRAERGAVGGMMNAWVSGGGKAAEMHCSIWFALAGGEESCERAAFSDDQAHAFASSMSKA